MNKIKISNAMTVDEAREQISAYGKAMERQYTHVLRVRIAIVALLAVLCIGLCLAVESVFVIGIIILPIVQLVLVPDIVLFHSLRTCNRAMGDLSFFKGCSDDVIFHFENRYACYVKGMTWHVYGDIGLDYEDMREAVKAKTARYRARLSVLRNIGLVLFVGTMITAAEVGYEVIQEVEGGIGDNWVLGNFCLCAATLVAYGEMYLAFIPWTMIIALKRFTRAIDEGKVSLLELFDVSRRYDISKRIFPMGQYEA